MLIPRFRELFHIQRQPGHGITQPRGHLFDNHCIILLMKFQLDYLKYVLSMALCMASPVAAAAPLNDGQNIHRNTVPTIEKRSEVFDAD